jgi:hypothetical protein
MAGETVTLALNGEVPVDQYADAVGHWAAMLARLTAELYPGARVEWIIEDLQPESATTTARVEADEPVQLGTILRAYADVGRDLQARREPSHSPGVRQHAQAIVRHIGPRITSIRFETPDDDVTITALGSEAERPLPLRSFGTVTGRVQMLGSRRHLGFTLYDDLFDRAVNCYLRAEQNDLIRDKWNRRVMVEGTISRDPESGRPIAVRDIVAIELLPEVGPDDYRAAEGMFADLPGDESLVTTMRRLRDDW